MISYSPVRQRDDINRTPRRCFGELLHIVLPFSDRGQHTSTIPVNEPHCRDNHLPSC